MRPRYISATGVSFAAHLVVAALFLWLAGREAEPSVPAPSQPSKIPVVFLPSPGKAGGGGGGPKPAARQPLEVPKHQQPAPTPVDPQPTQPEPPKPLPTLDMPIETDAARMLRFNGMTGIERGLGGPPGPGAGPDPGGGLGPGGPGGTGGGPREPGGDVTDPVPIKEVKPDYTGEAMRRRLQGPVELSVVVLANGTVGDVQILKAFNPAFGLDVAAIHAAKQWVFKPARHQGRPVDVRVRIILEFKLY